MLSQHQQRKHLFCGGNFHEEILEEIRVMGCKVLLRAGWMPEIISLMLPTIMWQSQGTGVLFIADWVGSCRNCFTCTGKSTQAVSGFETPREREKELIIWP